MTLVTLSASYGAGGSELGPRLAERLGVPFLDRAITSQVAERLEVPLAEAESRDDAVGGLLARMVRRLAPMGQAFGASAPAYDSVDDAAYCQTTEAIVRKHAASGDAVILGRSGALILRDHPSALHVRLDGPREARIERMMRLHGIDRATAERSQAQTDRAREAYARHFYRTDVRDPAHYHLVLDPTAIGLDTTLELIAIAAASRGG
jgi:cytidylate kinase